jgi:hypothetical protein
MGTEGPSESRFFYRRDKLVDLARNLLCGVPAGDGLVAAPDRIEIGYGVRRPYGRPSARGHITLSFAG